MLNGKIPFEPLFNTNGTIPYEPSLPKTGIEPALQELLRTAGALILPEAKSHLRNVAFILKGHRNQISLPCPLKETEAISALKATEASTVAAIADLRYGPEDRNITINVARATCSLLSCYLSTVDGLGKFDPGIKSKLKDTDLLQAQSILYRRLAANLYRCRNSDEYFFPHGSLEATTTLNMIGLEGHRPDMTEYQKIIDLIESHVMRFSAEEMEALNAKYRQAGVVCQRPEVFKETEYGRSTLGQPPWSVENLEDKTPPVPFSPTPQMDVGKPQPLAGIKVLELCRIIAGPMVGRTLAEYGADVIKVTAPYLSDVPYFQVDGNMGKHTLDLNLRDQRDRNRFESLLLSTDVVIGGYRPDSLTRLGYGPTQILKLIAPRNKGIVCISESCYGALPPSSKAGADSESSKWAHRPGWQPQSDCVTGVAWTQGRAFMEVDEPFVPAFPMADYGTGCAGTIAALTGLYKRAKEGGSWWGSASLVGYNVYLHSLGIYPPSVLEELKWRFREAGFYGHVHGKDGLRHNDSAEIVAKRAIAAMKQVSPTLFDEKHVHEAYCKGYGAPVKYVRSSVNIGGIRVGFKRGTRPNGFDEGGWENWEVEDSFVNA